MPLADRTARLAAVESTMPKLTLASSAAKEPKRRKPPHVEAPAAKRSHHDQALSNKVDTLASEFAQIKSLLLSLQPAGPSTVLDPTVQNDEGNQTDSSDAHTQEDTMSIAASDSLFREGDADYLESHGEGSHSPSASVVSSHSSNLEPMGVDPEFSSVHQAIELALSRLGIDKPVEAAPTSAFFRVSQKPVFSVPASLPYIEELQRCWADPKSFSHFTRDCRTMSAMQDATKYGLDRMPPVDGAIAGLVVAPTDAARPEARCPRPQCRVTDDLITKSYDTAARIGRLGNSLSHLALALSQSLKGAGVDSATQSLSDASLQAFAYMSRELGRLMSTLTIARRQARCLDPLLSRPWNELLRQINHGVSLLNYIVVPGPSPGVLVLFAPWPEPCPSQEPDVLLMAKARLIGPLSSPHFGHREAEPRDMIARFAAIAPPGQREPATVEHDARCPAPSGFSQRHLSRWEALVSDPWVVSTLSKGYSIQFKRRPPKFDGVRLTVVSDPDRSLALRQEIQELLQKGAIEVVQSSEQLKGFYSNYFLVPKKDGGFRPILDLRRLNRYVKVLRFHMLRTTDVLQSVMEGDWFTSIDLKDAYFHVPVVPHHRQFLRFAFEGQAFQFRVLPFGLSLAPRTFTRCVAAALAPLQAQGLRILPYLDDWLVCAQSRNQALRDTYQLLDHVSQLGLAVNFAKSSLVPSQQIVFIGIMINSVTMKASPSPQRVMDVLNLVSQVLRNRRVSFGLLLQLMGKLTSVSTVIPLGLLHLRPLQIWLNDLGLDPQLHQHKSVQLSNQCLQHLQPWGNQEFLCSGVPLGSLPCRREVVVTDASLTGWGAVWNHRMVRGVWSPQERLQHINVLELRATGTTTRRVEIEPSSGTGNLEEARAEQSAGAGCAGTSLAGVPLVCLSSFSTSTINAAQDSQEQPQSVVGSSILARENMVPHTSAASQRGTLASSSENRSLVTAGREHLASSSRTPSSLSVALEGPDSMLTTCDQAVVQTIMNARAASTRALYDNRWTLFVKWCMDHDVNPEHCSVPVLLDYLQTLLDKGLSVSTIKVYVAAISARHSFVDGRSVGSHSLVSRFLKGALRLRPPRLTRVPSWDLPLVLEGLCSSPFEPLNSAALKWVSIKTVFLLAISSAKRIGELHALSIADNCIRWNSDGSGVTLWPNPSFLPKRVSAFHINQPLSLAVFAPQAEPGSSDASLLCPVRMLRKYIDITAGLRKIDALFVCYGGHRKGCAVSKQRLSHWVVDAIVQAYGSKCLQPPKVTCHSTRGVSTSWAALKGVPLNDICAAATWASSCTFARFYRVNVATPHPVAPVVLSASAICN
ncbi:hypothetical protein WMY93_030420 [Mugilogobius chulae]|uniref:ribonuclease H n=1 Tax=Mugilogobius chulae TaxID=88201 RepID=A0AAW0MK81_9GOBI